MTDKMKMSQPKKPAPVAADEDDMPMTPEMKQSLQEQKDEKMRQKMKDAYDKANVNKGYKAGGKVSSASKRADGCVQRGKTKGKMV